ncbi:hypothetical protein Vafri_12788 [Volvox africanus]|uniref:Uncharacterized protein n=1 Tax=Volvox africanus TaxID=51714 RepID=A0A8J4BAM7_9CHLO|nr:hypothetical protein Vafri_12788 [Volvox africanus]
MGHGLIQVGRHRQQLVGKEGGRPDNRYSSWIPGPDVLPGESKSSLSSPSTYHIWHLRVLPQRRLGLVCVSIVSKETTPHVLYTVEARIVHANHTDSLGNKRA